MLPGRERAERKERAARRRTAAAPAEAPAAEAAAAAAARAGRRLVDANLAAVQLVVLHLPDGLRTIQRS